MNRIVNGLPLGRWIRQRWQSMFDRWLSQRLPRRRSVTLNLRSVFIAPSRNGLYFLLMSAVLFLGGINYGNSLILMIAMLLVSLFLVSILHTYANLSGLTFEAGRTQPAFVGQQAAFGIHLSSQGRPHESIRLSWAGVPGQQLNLIDDRSLDITQMLPVTQRGYRQAPRLRVESCYPLGLLRAWSWVELDSRCLVYPKPIMDPYPLRSADHGEQGDRLWSEGSDDFDGLRRYQSGDNPRRIAWKSYAREGRLYSKTFTGYQADEHWLDWQAYSGIAVESRLGRLCFQVLQCGHRGIRFGLRLPGVEIPPASGDTHQQRCLAALALHGLTDDSLVAVAADQGTGGRR